MHFLLTRPEEDNQILAQNLERLGHDVTSDALLHIDYFGTETNDLSKFQAVLFTSANGVRALLASLHGSLLQPDIPCFAVGDATAKQAKQAGFTDVYSAAGNVDDLAKIVAKTLNPEQGPMLHICGKNIAGDLSKVLEERGFHVVRRQLYQATKATKLSDNTHKMIVAGKITHMPFYSPRTAKTFSDLVQSANLAHYLKPITAVCLSPAVSDMIDFLPWHKIIIASQPNHHSLFKMIGIKLEENRQ